MKKQRPPKVYFVRTSERNGGSAGGEKSPEPPLTEIRWRVLREGETYEQVAQKLTHEYKTDALFRLIETRQTA